MNRLSYIISRILAALCFPITLAACDEGRIYPDTSYSEGTGRTLKFNVAFDHIDRWPSVERYRICVAGYKDGAVTPATYSDISHIEPGQPLTITLKNVDREVTTAALSITTLSHRLVYNIFAERIPVAESRELNAKGLRMEGLFSYVQEGIFDERCISCHGDGRKSAGLDLTRGNSYDMLVGRASVTGGGSTLVEPGDADISYISSILENAELPANAGGLNHVTTVMLDNDMLLLLREWINSGSEKD